MPVYKIIKDIKNTQILLWKITENKKMLLKQANLSAIDYYRYNLILNVKRKKEFLAIRCALISMGIYEKEILYTNNGQPVLKNNKNYISFSHTNDIVSIAISRYPVGVDIEFIRDKKIIYLQKKFIRNDETSFINDIYIVDKLHIIWGIKESLYKINNGYIKNIIKNYKVMPFHINDIKIKTWLLKNNISKMYWAWHKKIDKYQLVYIIDI